MTGMIRRRASALALMVVASVLAACSSASGTSSVPVPPVSASPGHVARVYLRAALTGDCKLTAELTVSHTWSWCADPRLLGYRSVRRPVNYSAEECVPFEMDTLGSSDGTMPDGWQPWELCLVKTRAGWRLYDQGSGG